MEKALFIDFSGSMHPRDMPNIPELNNMDAFYFDMYRVVPYSFGPPLGAGSSCDKIVEFCDENKDRWDEIVIYTDGYIIPPPVSFEMKITWVIIGDPQWTEHVNLNRPQDTVVYI